MTKKTDKAAQPQSKHKPEPSPAPSTRPAEPSSESRQSATVEAPAPSAEVLAVEEAGKLTPITVVYKNHPLADIFPLMPKNEIQALADDIKKNGQHELAVIHKGKILDGRNRAAACKIVGVQLKTMFLPADTDPVVYVIAANLRRRQLTPAQLAIVAAKLMPHYAEEAAERKKKLSGTRAKPRSQTVTTSPLATLAKAKAKAGQDRTATDVVDLSLPVITIED